MEHTSTKTLMEPDVYLKPMRTRPLGRAQWGGFPEDVVFAYMLKGEVGFFRKKPSQSEASASGSPATVSLMCDPVKPPSIVGRVCLLRRRTHDLLTLTDPKSKRAQARPC